MVVTAGWKMTICQALGCSNKPNPRERRSFFKYPILRNDQRFVRSGFTISRTRSLTTNLLCRVSSHTLWPESHRVDGCRYCAQWNFPNSSLGARHTLKTITLWPRTTKCSRYIIMSRMWRDFRTKWLRPLSIRIAENYKQNRLFVIHHV